MDIDKTQTREYREQQFATLAGKPTEYQNNIKISNDYGHTHWLRITDRELKEIMKILTK